MGIYCLQAEGLPEVKIGYSGGDGRLRRQGLQTGNARKLIRLAWIPSATQHDERELHAALKEAGAHIAGEWFNLDHEAVCIVLMHAREDSPQRIVRYLRNYLRRESAMPDEWAHRYCAHGMEVTLRNAKKQCAACSQWLPITPTYWGDFWIYMGEERIRAQPRCLSCRTDGYFRDDKTGDLFGGRM